MRLLYTAHRAQPDDSRPGAFNSGSRATLIRESRGQISTLLGFLTVCCAVALAREVPAAQTTDTVMLLSIFSRQFSRQFARQAVRQACLARGWRFDDRVIVQR